MLTWSFRLDTSFVPWLSDLRTHIQQRYPLPAGIEPIPEHEFLKPPWKLTFAPLAQNGYDQSAINGNPPAIFHNGHVQADHEVVPVANKVSSHTSTLECQRIAVRLEENNRLTPHSHWQDVRHLVFISESPAVYEPGDVLTVYPKNSASDVTQLLKRMDWIDVADTRIRFTPTKTVEQGNSLRLPPILLPSRETTLRALLTNHLDITAIPRRSFFTFISHFTDDQFHKDRLLEFTKPEYTDELYDYTTRPRRSILEVLQEFESVKIPWQWAATFLPELRGRQFSIASGGILKQTPTGTARFELLVAIVKYKTVIKKIREGVCTRYLAAMPVGTQLVVNLQKGALGFNKDDAKRPVVLIGPGTGVAPLRSMIWERALLNRDSGTSDGDLDPIQVDRSGLPGNNVLFFGCRSDSADYFFRQEWQNLKVQIPLEVHVAFSRDQDTKMYVQDLLRRESQSLWSSIHEDNGLVFVCGSSGKMPQAVRAALADVFMNHGKMNQDEANEYLETMEKEGRYKQETW